MSGMTSKGTASSVPREGFLPSEPLTLAGGCLDADTWGLLTSFAERAPLVELKGNFDRYHASENESLSEWMGSPSPDICLIDFDRDRRSATEVAEKVHSTSPETAIFAVSSQAQPDLIIQSMRS